MERDGGCPGKYQIQSRFHLKFCDGNYRYVFKEELNLFSVDYITRQRIPIFNYATPIRLTYANGTSEVDI